jgi:hypothetical protein
MFWALLLAKRSVFKQITETTDLGTEVWKSGCWILTADLDSPYHCECVYIVYPVPEFIDPRFRENKTKTLEFSHRKREF